MGVTTGNLLPPDHLDLLVTACVRWEILTGSTRQALTRTESHLGAVNANHAGRVLQAENLAALRKLTDRGQSRLTDRAVPDPYTFTEVELLEPVEVIKACHAYEHAAQGSLTWAGSAARRLVAAVCTAAAQRLEGYGDAPWVWTRPQVRSGPCLALGRSWRPQVPGLTWADAETIADEWATAAIVVITVEAASDLPAGLVSRAGVFLLVNEEAHAQVWEAVSTVAPEHVLFWPECSPWLADLVRDPAPVYTHHREQ